MRVLVAGATGAIGRPLVGALIAAGYEVTGITSSEVGLQSLRSQGADGIVANALDSNLVNTAVAKVRPQAIIDELTSLPKRYTPEEMRAAAPRDRMLRLEGGRNLQNAAIAIGARRYIVQSTGFFYAPGPGLATEEDPLALNASPAVAGSVQTYSQIEDRVLHAPNLEGIALRYGFFYGPGTYHDPATGSISEQVRDATYPVIGSGEGVYSFVHIEDAAAATVAALECHPGVYNVVDDDPSTMATWLPAFAHFLGAQQPPHISVDEVGPDALYYATRLRGCSNAKAKRKLNFTPRPLAWLHA